MGAIKPGPQGEHEGNRKPIAQGMPDDSAAPVVFAASFFSAGGPWVRPSPGIPCALFPMRARRSADLGRDLRREIAISCGADCAAISKLQCRGNFSSGMVCSEGGRICCDINDLPRWVKQ